jgi:hypothetical protein
MTAGPEVEVEVLRRALAQVLDAVEALFGSTVDLEADHYWTLDPRLAFDPSAEQSEGMAVAQLSDDVREIHGYVERADDPVIWHDLAHIVGVLRRLAALDLPSGETVA